MTVKISDSDEATPGKGQLAVAEVPPTEPSNTAKRKPGKKGTKKVRTKAGNAKRRAVRDAPPLETEHVADGESLKVRRDQPHAGVSERRWFWLGSMPSLGAQNGVHVAGHTFPRTHEIVLDRQAGSASERIPHIGYCAQLSRSEIEVIKERLPFMVFRFTDGPEFAPDPGGPGDGIEVLRGPLGEQIGRRGYPIRIKSEEEMAMRKKERAPAAQYHPQAWDEDLADHVFCIPCVDQQNPRTGGTYPDPLTVTGLEWPE